MFNWFKTALLMAGIMALFGVIGAYIGGAQGMLIALLFGAGMNVFAYWFSDSMVLKMYDAQEVDAASAPQFYNMVRKLAQRDGSALLPRPRNSASSAAGVAQVRRSISWSITGSAKPACTSMSPRSCMSTNGACAGPQPAWR